jgi:L-ribulose-5-phosphate 3-epimerase
MELGISSPARDVGNGQTNPAHAWPVFMTGAAQQRYLSAEDGIVTAARNGYSHWYIDGSLDGEHPQDFPPARVDRIRELMAELQMRPIFHGNFKVPLGSDVAELGKAAIQYIRREVDLCCALDGAPLIVHGGGIVEPRLVVEARKRGLHGLIDGLKAVASYAAEKNVPIWLENLSNYTEFHPFYYIYTNSDEYELVLESVPSVSFFLDVSHSNVNDGNPVAVFERFNRRIIAMSFSDNEGVRDSHLPLGNGNLDYAGLVRSMLHHKWHGIIGFETRGSELRHSLPFLNRLAEQALGKADHQ